MNRIMNIAFSALIRVNNSQREFNFRRRRDDSYDCDVSGEYGERFFFRMIWDEEIWKIENRDLPDWITGTVGQIDRLLKEKEGLTTFRKEK